MPHRLRVIAEIVVGLAKAELNVDAMRRVETRSLGQGAHAIHQRTVGLRHSLHHGQFQKGGRENLGGLGEAARGLLEHAAVRQELPEESPRPGHLRRLTQQTANFGLRFLELALHLKRLGQIEPARGGVVGASAQLAMNEQGFALAPHLAERGCKMAERALEAGLEFDRPLQAGSRLSRPPGE